MTFLNRSGKEEVERMIDVGRYGGYWGEYPRFEVGQSESDGFTFVRLTFKICFTLGER